MLCLNMEMRNYTISKMKKRRNPDKYNLLNLEQLHEIAYCLDKPEWIAELTEKYNEMNNFPQMNCCICLMDKCETEMVKMRKKVDGISTNSCACNTDICCDCIKLISNKCPTCRTQFNSCCWLK